MAYRLNRTARALRRDQRLMRDCVLSLSALAYRPKSFSASGEIGGFRVVVLKLPLAVSGEAWKGH